MMDASISEGNRISGQTKMDNIRSLKKTVGTQIFETRVSKIRKLRRRVSGSASKEDRKISKPLMERKRRARINESLDQLKSLVLEARNEKTRQMPKLEKADILDLAVKHLEQLRRRQLGQESAQDAHPLDHMSQIGYHECLGQIERHIGECPGVDAQTKTRLLKHLKIRTEGAGDASAPCQTASATGNDVEEGGRDYDTCSYKSVLRRDDTDSCSDCESDISSDNIVEHCYGNVFVYPCSASGFQSLRTTTQLSLQRHMTELSHPSVRTEIRGATEHGCIRSRGTDVSSDYLGDALFMTSHREAVSIREMEPTGGQSEPLNLARQNLSPDQPVSLQHHMLWRPWF